MTLEELTDKLHQVDRRLLVLETEWSVRKSRETNMPGWIFGAISAVVAVLMAIFWWFVQGGP